MTFPHTEKPTDDAPAEVRVYRYRLTDSRERWLTLIAPGNDLETARNVLRGQFGDGRVLEVEEEIPCWARV